MNCEVKIQVAGQEKAFSLTEEALRFFVMFSRFEYALKKAGFLPGCPQCNEGKLALADWDKFANTLDSNFWEDFREQYLVTSPPKKQIVHESKADFPKDGKSIHNNQTLFLAIRTVRNNFFHGGKYPNPTGPIPGAERDDALIKCCLDVLEKALACPKAKSVADNFLEEA